MTAPQTTSASYEVGYRKPPRHTQFQKGQSGNPGGRPCRLPAERLEELALYEAYRTTIVMEDGHATPMSAIQAVLRSQLQSAAGGNVRAQRDVLAMIRDIELVRSVTARFETGGTDDVVDDTDDADAIDADDSDIDDTADADRDDAGSTDDDEAARQQADEIDTDGEGRPEERGVLHPPLKGEGRIAEGDPGWGGGGAGDDDDAVYAEALSPPPGPLTRADLPPPGGGEEAWEPTAPPAVSAPLPENAAALAGRTPSLPSGSGSGQRRSVLPRRNGPERCAGVKPARPQPRRRRGGSKVNAGKIRRAQAGTARAPAAPSERDEKLKIPC
jgi:Family of unknown function (DUF5681)